MWVCVGGCVSVGWWVVRCLWVGGEVGLVFGGGGALVYCKKGPNQSPKHAPRRPPSISPIQNTHTIIYINQKQAEAEARLAADGRNVLHPPRELPLFVNFLLYLFEGFGLLLWAGACVFIIFSKWMRGWVWGDGVWIGGYAFPPIHHPHKQKPQPHQTHHKQTQAPSSASSPTTP